MAKGDKRARHPRSCSYSRLFSKDWERLSRSGRYDMVGLKQAILLLIANDAPLGPEWKDHPLKGNWEGFRECQHHRTGRGSAHHAGPVHPAGGIRGLGHHGRRLFHRARAAEFLPVNNGGDAAIL